MKNILKTSEFWTTLVGTAVSLLVMSGKLTPDQGSTVAETVTSIAAGVVSLLATLGIVNIRVTNKRIVFEAKLDAAGMEGPAARSTINKIDAIAKDL